MDTLSFSVSFKGTPFSISDWPANATLGDLKVHMEGLTSIPAQGQKIIFKGLLKDNDKTLTDLKVVRGAKLIMMGSSADEVRKVLEGDKRIVHGPLKGGRGGRKAPARTVATPADSRYTFQRVEVIEEFPEPTKARKLLERLRDDPGIRGIMKHYNWSVGTLTELTPFEKTILGFNRNYGELISLRLRTNDMEGFRNYKEIRRVLLHELAHNVWLEHDNNFHTLQRQLNKDVISMDWTAKGNVLSNVEYYNPAEEEDIDEGGKTWEGGQHRLGGGAGQSGNDREVEDVATRREKIAQAAMLRLTREEQELNGQCNRTDSHRDS